MVVHVSKRKNKKANIQELKVTHRVIFHPPSTINVNKDTERLRQRAAAISMGINEWAAEYCKLIV